MMAPADNKVKTWFDWLAARQIYAKYIHKDSQGRYQGCLLTREYLGCHPVCVFSKIIPEGQQAGQTLHNHFVPMFDS